MKAIKPGLVLTLALLVSAALAPRAAQAQITGGRLPPQRAPMAAPVRPSSPRRLPPPATAAAPTRGPVTMGPPASQAGVDPNLARGMSQAGALSAVAQSLQQIHLTTCSARVMQIATFLFEGQDARFITQPMGPDADRWPTEFMIESIDPNASGRTRAATVVVNPDCSGMYQQTIFWSRPCAEVRATTFAQLQAAPIQLLNQSVVLDGEKGALQVFLMAAGSGCISIKKEMFH